MAAASYVLVTSILILSFVYSNPEKLGYTELVYNAASDSKIASKMSLNARKAASLSFSDLRKTFKEENIDDQINVLKI